MNAGNPDPIDAIRGVLRQSAESFGPRAVAHIRGLISTPGGDDNHSREGEAPRQVSGELSGSITYRVDDDGEGAVTLVPYSDARHAPVLEFTLNRPFMAPALQDLAPQFIDAVAADLAAALR